MVKMAIAIRFTRRLSNWEVFWICGLAAASEYFANATALPAVLPKAMKKPE